MDTHKTSVLEFPCEFPIKAIGRAEAGLREQVVAIVGRHVPQISSHSIKSTSSRGGRYQSVTVLVMATSQAQLDDIYRDLTACEAVIMAL
jgi:hypothetical protein